MQTPKSIYPISLFSITFMLAYVVEKESNGTNQPMRRTRHGGIAERT